MPKRLGRPTKAPKPGTRVPLSFRVTAGVRQQLEETAIANGRSLSQEAELRLEESFKWGDLAGMIKEDRARLDRLMAKDAELEELIERKSIAVHTLAAKKREIEKREREVEKREREIEKHKK